MKTIFVLFLLLLTACETDDARSTRHMRYEQERRQHRVDSVSCLWNNQKSICICILPGSYGDSITWAPEKYCGIVSRSQ